MVAYKRKGRKGRDPEHNLLQFGMHSQIQNTQHIGLVLTIGTIKQMMQPLLEVGGHCSSQVRGKYPQGWIRPWLGI